MAGRRAPGARSARTGRYAADQHFLRNQRLAAALVRDARVERDDLVVEIGAGSGRLTSELAARAREVRAIELDPRWAERLRERFVGDANVSVIEADALVVPLPQEPFCAVANVPFGLTTALIRRLLDDARVPLTRADLIVEWGLARKRASVWPSSLLGVCWGARFELAVVRRLPAACFEPKPSVDAGVLRIRAREEPLVPPEQTEAFRRFVARGFEGGSGVRRPLAGLVPRLGFKRLADELGFERAAAARELDVHQWAALFALSRARTRSASSRGSRPG